MEINKGNTVQLNDFRKVYFLGIGGIGMSALARYFNSIGYEIGGYDKTTSPLTDELVREGCIIHFDDLGTNIPNNFCDNKITLVIYTPAIPEDHRELGFFKSSGFTILKRSEVLGLLTQRFKGLCVAGTHGKTTTSSMLAHILNKSPWGCTAFLGGVSTNLNSNLLINQSSEFAVIEADEFDRSFLRLSPFSSIITSADPDHLDIYGDANHFLEGFQLYAEKISQDGFMIIKKGLTFKSQAKTISYSVSNNKADFFAENIRIQDGQFLMDVKFSTYQWNSIELGVPGIHNAENALACLALLVCMGMEESQIRSGIQSFLGVKRRFEYIIKDDKFVYIDDYAHHPQEIKALIASIRMIYPNKRITGIFQPHLFSRTRDFMGEFAHELTKLDQVILLPIYPARELPITGVTSESLLEKIENKDKKIMDLDRVVSGFSITECDVLLTIGAGDIDRIVDKLKEKIEEQLFV
ncbi:MAG: UDP-N-acetylmuramate--L-alanine ligase [Bacteroidetes bacterium]|nr:UDP-N-acetylmuramate--L-alanine ligase [Bacteroidota bacterium]